MQINIDVDKIIRDRIPQDTRAMEQMLQIMMDDSNEFLPRDQDALLSSGKIEAASPIAGTFGWYTPYAHYQFRGELMVGRDTGSSWARHDEPKVYTGIPLNHSRDKNPNAQKEWVEVARKKYGERWRRQWAKLTGGK